MSEPVSMNLYECGNVIPVNSSHLVPHSTDCTCTACTLKNDLDKLLFQLTLYREACEGKCFLCVGSLSTLELFVAYAP